MNDEATELARELAAAVADQYAVLREVGRGQSAVVFLATDLKHGRSVALKVLRAQLDATVSHDRFLGEIRTTARLNHPHILPLFDSGEAQGRVFFTMPVVEGESLRERRRRETRLSVDEALRITGEVASALEYAHARRVVHRAIKPENILLSASGHAFVSDFGVASALDAARSVARTDPGFAVGTQLRATRAPRARARRRAGIRRVAGVANRPLGIGRHAGARSVHRRDARRHEPSARWDGGGAGRTCYRRSTAVVVQVRSIRALVILSEAKRIPPRGRAIRSPLPFCARPAPRHIHYSVSR